ncbi:MAG: sensor histidine kinase [Delftia acidovorans]|nr:sensor histidine kinase [Delftia acidovorans]
MSNIHIKRAVSNIKDKTSIYTPIVEAIVNSIQAIKSKEEANGLITVTLNRNTQLELDGTQSGDRRIEEIQVRDNGIGFNEENQESFDTLYSDLKINEGGKGFGRLTYLKYFDHVWINSVYQRKDGTYWSFDFKMGDEKHFITKEASYPVKNINTGSITRLSGLKKKSAINQTAKTIARNLVELLLPYFITKEYSCPTIILMEEDESERITLNEYLLSEEAVIKEIPLIESEFSLQGTEVAEKFKLRLFKIFSPGSKVSKISLVADKREVETAFLHRYIPEFEDEFFEPSNNPESPGRNYIVKAYVFGKYLDDNVSIERGGFNFRKDRDENSELYSEICQTDIEREAAKLANTAFSGEVASRLDRKKAIIQEYVEKQAPWYRETLKEVDLNEFSMHPKPEEMEAILHKEQFKTEKKLRAQVKSILDKEEPSDQNDETASALAKNISEKSKSELIHYVALRKYLLDLLARKLEYRDDGKHHTEGAVHDIIFPRKKDTDNIPYEGHNLWILDERLSFTNYVSSDTPFNGGNTDRGDVIVYGHRIAMRGENITTNPITIFEFKRPGRDDFTDPSSTEDPIAQIVRYANRLRDKRFKTPPGRPMEVNENTPFYGYVVCDFTPKVEEWLEREKSFTPMPDRKGWFSYLPGPKIYIEVLSWDKVLNDAILRNKIFFHKLGI